MIRETLEVKLQNDGAKNVKRIALNTYRASFNGSPTVIEQQGKFFTMHLNSKKVYFENEESFHLFCKQLAGTFRYF